MLVEKDVYSDKHMKHTHSGGGGRGKGVKFWTLR
jgi:hypothetical protein